MHNDLSLDYANAEFIDRAEEFPLLWDAKATAFRTHLGDRFHGGIPYGDGARQALDLCLPTGTPRGLVVFIHGGYWLMRERSIWTHLAAGALARDWAVALPGYTLAPQARIHEITSDVEASITAAAKLVSGPIVVTGHSAGGHLAARMGCSDRTPEWLGRLVRVLPVSPIADLEPIRHTAMQRDLRIDDAEVKTESPARHKRHADVECCVWVGGQERPTFLWHARTLSENWNCPWHVAPGRHHFDVIEDLEDPQSLLVQTLLG